MSDFHDSHMSLLMRRPSEALWSHSKAYETPCPQWLGQWNIEAIIWPLRGVPGHSRESYLIYYGNTHSSRLWVSKAAYAISHHAWLHVLVPTLLSQNTSQRHSVGHVTDHRPQGLPAHPWRRYGVLDEHSEVSEWICAGRRA